MFVSSRRSYHPLLAMALLAYATTAALGQEVAVTLRSGRTFHGEVSPRTNAQTLWLRFRGGSTVVLRPIEWPAVVSAVRGARELTRDDLTDLAQQSPADLQRREPAATPSSMPADQATAGPWLDFQPRVASVHFDAHLANWDADVQADGLILRVYPLDERGRFTPVSGVARVEARVLRRESFDQRPDASGSPTVLFERWTVRLDPDSLTSDGYVCKLPFRRADPELDTRLAPHALLHLTWSAAGHGVFHDSLDHVRVRAFSPTRDRLQLQTGGRLSSADRRGR